MSNNINFIIKKNGIKRYIVFFLLMAVIVMGFVYDVYGLPLSSDEDVVQGISDSLIRFHVVANSDSDSDQALKLLVRDAVIKEMEVLLEPSTSIDETREIIDDNLEQIKLTAEEIVAENGQDVAVSIALKQESFPVKKYGDIILPSGEYEALVIGLGEAKGKNWWCILFPPLCFVDATHGVVDDEAKEGLQNVLTDEEYNEIVMSEDSDVDITIKFKLVEWLQGKEEDGIGIKSFAKIFD